MTRRKQSRQGGSKSTQLDLKGKTQAVPENVLPTTRQRGTELEKHFILLKDGKRKDRIGGPDRKQNSNMVSTH